MKHSKASLIAHTIGAGVVVLSLILSQRALALVIDIQGSEHRIEQPGATCIDIGGQYSGFQIEPSEAGKTPRICFSSRRRNTVSLHHVTFVSTNPSVGEINVRFRHEFKSGPSGLVYARAALKGFFAKVTGTAAPVGDELVFTCLFSQGGQDDPIGEKFTTVVGEDLESALLDMKARDEYLTSGTRALKGVLTIRFQEPGDKLVLHEGTSIVIDSVKRFSDIVEDDI